jgi:hypothetical protein
MQEKEIENIKKELAPLREMKINILKIFIIW